MHDFTKPRFERLAAQPPKFFSRGEVKERSLKSIHECNFEMCK